MGLYDPFFSPFDPYFGNAFFGNPYFYGGGYWNGYAYHNQFNRFGRPNHMTVQVNEKMHDLTEQYTVLGIADKLRALEAKPTV